MYDDNNKNIFIFSLKDDNKRATPAPQERVRDKKQNQNRKEERMAKTLGKLITKFNNQQLMIMDKEDCLVASLVLKVVQSSLTEMKNFSSFGSFFCLSL